MGEAKQNLAVGLTALVAVVGLMGLLLLFGTSPAWLEQDYAVTVLLEDSGGLSEGSRVRLNGLDVGRIAEVRLREPVTDGVVAVARIRDDYLLPRGIQATVPQALFVGSPTLQLNASHLSAKELEDKLPTDGSAVLQGTVAGPLASLSGPGQDGADLGQVLSERITNLEAQFSALSGDLQQLSQTWDRVGQNIEQLTAPRTAEQVEAGEAPGNLVSLIERLDARAGDAEEVMTNLNAMLGDEQMRADLSQTLANTRALTEDLGKTVEKVDKTLASTQGGVDRLVERYVTVADELAAGLSEIRKLVRAARSGKGTLARLVKDPALYENLNDAVLELEKGIQEVQLLVQKWKAEGLPVQY